MTPRIEPIYKPGPTPYDPAPRGADLSTVELAVIERLEIEPAEFLAQRAKLAKRGRR